MIAPLADTADGLIEVTRVGPIGRWDFALTFPKIFTGAQCSIRSSPERPLTVSIFNCPIL